MNLRATGKKLHRRTQSHTTFSLNGVVDKKNNSDEFVQEMLSNHNVLGGDFTQKVLDAVNKDANEKEVIVDDIDDIPNTGIIIPHGAFNSLNNPLNSIQRRSLLMRNNYQTSGSQFKKIDMLSQVKNIDDITGLNTIHEKRNSMESIETENMNKRSPNHTHSGSSSQNISKTVSRGHSKHPSLDFRIGHSNNSSIDFRPMHSRISSGDMWSMHSKQSSIDMKPGHSKQSSADFRTLSINKDPFNLGVRVEKEIDVIKYNLLSPKTMKVGDTFQHSQHGQHGQHGPNLEYFDKRNRFISELQKTSADKFKRGNSGSEHTTKAVHKNDEVTKAKPKLVSNTGFDAKDKFKPSTTKSASKHRRTYSGNVGKSGELISPREDLAQSGIFLTGKNHKDTLVHENMHMAIQEIQQDVVNMKNNSGNSSKGGPKKVKVDESMKILSTKTDVLEGQIKNIFSIIESFASEKATLEDKIQTQDKKIKELMDLTTKYQEEIRVLKGKNSQKISYEKKPSTSGSNKTDSATLNILTTTDGSGSAFESSVTESSGYLSNKDPKISKKSSAIYSQTPQSKINFNKTTEEKKSLGFFANKSDLIPKKSTVGSKKPIIKKI